MQLLVIQRILGLLLMVFSLTMLPPIGVSLWYDDHTALAFVEAFALTLVIGLLCWLPARAQRKELRLRDGFMVVVMFWTALSMVSALPFMMAEHPHMSFTDAVFESVSGFTTTGATVIVGLDQLPRAILYYRQQLQFLGGMGIVVLAVAIFPMLGIGGMQLYRAETPGPMKDNKLTPRITETARALWYIYLGLTVACALAYWLAGMSLFDAIGHSFATVSTGGFSTHDASLGHFQNLAIEIIAMVFMLLGGINFAMHFMAWRQRDLGQYWRDAESRGFFYIVAAIIAITTVTLVLTRQYPDFLEALRYGAFQVITMITSTGFLTADFSAWPLFLPVLLIAIGFIGGCAGSTAGGMKVVRILLLYKQGLREILRLIHPNAIIPVKIGERSLPDRVVEAVWGFSVLYMVSFVLLALALMSTGLDAVTAFSGVATCLNLGGPGLGAVTMNFTTVNDFGIWLLSFAMLLGRLEVFTLLVLLTPAFWRK
ncbi:MAG: potassium transporter [Gammaproteobacteria bacterium]|nr:potassium transporter [Gammaproteobacteria bacterium]